MPKGSDALSPTQIGLVTQWISEGAIWEDPVADAAKSPPLLNQISEFADKVDKSTSNLPGRPVFIGSILAIFLVVLMIAALKERSVKASGKIQLPLIRRIHWGYYLLLVCCWVGPLIFFINGIQQENAANELAGLESQLAAANNQLSQYTGRGSVKEIFGDPPVPRRPEHPPTLAFTYYRGNCERHPDLFNNGNYLTAELSIGLRDQTGEVVLPESHLADRELTVQFEIKQGPNASDALYSDAIIQSVFLSDEFVSTTKPSETIQYCG